MRYANIYIYIFVLHRGFFQQPRDASPPGEDAFPPGEDASPLAEEYENPPHLLVIY